MSRNAQTSGDNSTQIQASGDVIIESGVTEERAHEIAKLAARGVIAEYAEESVRLIQDRITKLDDRVIASLIREGRLEVFADPGFQRSYTKAQAGAAVSDKDSDYDLLAGLLVDRAKRGATRNVRAGIERSIEIVDQIDDEALRGLTVFQAFQQYGPVSPYLEWGLDALEDLFADLVDGPLPEGEEWLDHLDILGTVRLDPVNPLKSFRDYYPSRFPGYLAPGAPVGSPQIPFVIDGKPIWSKNLLIKHELRPGYLRFAVATDTTLESTLPLVKYLHAELISQAKDRLGFGTIDPELIDPFLERLRLRPTLAQIENWWGNIPQAMQVTGVGKVLARSNALRLDTRNVLPPIS